jgi:hypothetical protein
VFQMDYPIVWHELGCGFDSTLAHDAPDSGRIPFEVRIISRYPY